MSEKLTAGGRLRRDMDALLVRAGKAAGTALAWDERELDALGRAAAAADRSEQLQKVFADELDGDARPAMLAKLSAEVRGLDRQVTDLLAKVNPGVGAAKSGRHQRAIQARWDRARAREA